MHWDRFVFNMKTNSCLYPETRKRHNVATESRNHTSESESRTNSSQSEKNPTGLLFETQHDGQFQEFPAAAAAAGRSAPAIV